MRNKIYVVPNCSKKYIYSKDLLPGTMFRFLNDQDENVYMRIVAGRVFLAKGDFFGAPDTRPVEIVKEVTIKAAEC